MLKEIFYDSFKNFEITRICMENHASVTGWQKLFSSYKCFQLSAAVTIATFEIYGWKCSGYLFFNMLFQLVQTKSSKVNCFRVYRKLFTWSSHAKNLLRHPYSVLLRSVLTDTHPPQERVATPLGSMSLTLLEQWCGFWFYVALMEEPDKWKCFVKEHTVFHPFPRRLEKITVCRGYYKGSTFFSVI